MKAAEFRSLGRVLGAVSQAAEAELGALNLRIAAAMASAARLRAAIAQPAPGLGTVAELAADAAWRHRLAAEARAAEAAAQALEAEVAELRERLKLAFGREQVVADLAERAARSEQRLRGRRAEDDRVPRRGAAQSPSSASPLPGGAGSPGMA